MKSLVIKLLISALVLLLGDYLMDSVTISPYYYAIILTATLGILNSLVKPILKILALPFTILTLGLFSFVISACIILLADGLMGTHFETTGFWSALGFSILISILNTITDMLMPDND
ncbi:phage holin family protein [Faecalibacter macacae]|uniref:Phage holin family protein n=1 Tax=Faecalibacter macacae TaxID=1859289 RepID=A0A3L9MJ78_9FLAO|nr:phage holin family protein [Faecalibacter macacae]RLZ12206.1 phage holin family protein [Faecalibacter macacae]